MPLLCLLWCYTTASLFALSPARNSEQWAGCATRSSARLAKSTPVFHAIVRHNRRIIQPTVTHSRQSSSHKRTPGCVCKKNVGHKGSAGAIWLKISLLLFVCVNIVFLVFLMITSKNLCNSAFGCYWDFDNKSAMNDVCTRNQEVVVQVPPKSSFHFFQKHSGEHTEHSLL